MPSLVIIGQQIKEKWRREMCPPAYIVTKYPSLNRVNGSLPWLQNTDGAICFISKEDIESVMHLFLDFLYFRNNFESLWNKLKFKIAGPNPTDGAYICNFIKNLNGHNKVLLLLGGLALPFDNETNILINRFIFSAVGKIHKLLNPISPGRFNSLSTWKGAESAPPPSLCFV